MLELQGPLRRPHGLKKEVACYAAQMESPQPQLRRKSYDPRRSGEAKGIITATYRGDEAEDIIAATPNGRDGRNRPGKAEALLLLTPFLPFRRRRCVPYAYDFPPSSAEALSPRHFIMPFSYSFSYAFFLRLNPTPFSIGLFLCLFLTSFPYAYKERHFPSVSLHLSAETFPSLRQCLQAKALFSLTPTPVLPLQLRLGKDATLGGPGAIQPSWSHAGVRGCSQKAS